MTDGTLFTETVKKSGYTLKHIAKELDISRQGLWKKINNRSEFKQSEMEKITRILSLDNETSSRIFFKHSVG